MEKPKKKPVTWGEAAKIVLGSSPCPLTHKEILKCILERNLKEVKLNGPAALACINAMLHANSRSPSDLFHKVEGRSGCYRLNENRVDPKEQATSDSESHCDSSNSVSSESKDQNEDDPPLPSVSFGTTSSGALPPISSMLGELAGQVTTTSSVTSSVTCAISDSRLNSLIAPSPENLPLTSALSKKRTVKPYFQREGPSTKKPRVTFKLDKEKKPKQDRPTRPPVKTKAELKYMAGDESSTCIPPVLKPPMDPTHTVVKSSSAAYFGQKKQKKVAGAAQVKRSKEGQVDLVSPDSVLSKVNVRNIINFKTFNLLPAHYQYKLVKMLPQVDQEVGSRGELRPSSSAFSNEFFTSAFRSWRERLSEGEFTPEMTQKIQQEEEKFIGLDPWKTKHFEPVWGEKLLSCEKYVSPVDSSVQILETVKHEYAQELERLKEKGRGTENEDLSAPNKMDRNAPGDEPAKNLTTKQRAALLRQQKLANAKNANKGTQKKPANRSSGGKNTSKDGQTKQESAGEKGSKHVERGKGRQTSKQNRASRAAGKTGEAQIINAITNEGTALLASEAVPSVQVVSSLPLDSNVTAIQDRSTATVETLLSTTVPKKPSIEKPKPAKNRKKVTVKSIHHSKPKTPIVTKQNATFECQCMLKSMVMCMMCGAFCHSDCINPMSVCTSCQVA